MDGEDAGPDLAVLIRVAATLEALMEVVKALPSPIPPDDRVPLMNRAQVLAKHTYNALDGERSEMLRTLVGDDVLLKGLKDLPSFSARAHIAVLYGFVRGCITEIELEAQRSANAEAYAEAKVKEERGVGFRSSSSAPE